jgi:hypothetical protein
MMREICGHVPTEVPSALQGTLYREIQAPAFVRSYGGLKPSDMEAVDNRIKGVVDNSFECDNSMDMVNVLRLEAFRLSAQVMRAFIMQVDGRGERFCVMSF